MNKLLQKWREMTPAAKSAIAFTLSSFIIKGITFLTTPVFTRILNQEQFGVISLFNSWQTIIEVIALLGLTSAGVFNVGLNDYKNKRGEYISSILGLCNLITVIVFGVIFVLKIFFGEDFILPTHLLIVMMINFIFSPAQTFWITRQRYEYKYKAAFLVSVFSSLISQGVSALAVLLLTNADGSSVKIWTGNLTYLLFEIPIYVLLLIQGRKFINFKIWKQVLVFAIPLIPHYLAQHVMAGADRIMIEGLRDNGLKEVAIYSIVANIGSIATILWSAVNASYVPYAFEKLNEKNYKDMNKTIVPLLLVYGIMCIGVCFVAPEVLHILGPESYQEGVYAVPPIAAVAFLNALYNVYADIEFYHKKSVYIAISTIVSACINVGLNYLLIPSFGYIAAAYTTLIANVVLIFMHFIGYRKANGEKVYNDLLFLILSAVIIGGCLLCEFIYVNDFFRYLVIGLILAVVIIQRKYILAILRSPKEKKGK